jgi:hypothetical protein
MEASDGGAPEVTTHSERAFGGGDELSAEEQAISGVRTPGGPQDPEYKDFADEDGDTAALAEGRAVPPTSSSDEPV